MKNRLFFNLSLFATVSLFLFTACENDDNSMANYEETAKMKFIIPEKNLDTTVLQINTVEDLQQTLTSVVTKREYSLLQDGWVKVEEEPQTRGFSRAKRLVRTDTVYVIRESADDYSDPSVYANFNAKFSTKMVDSINKTVPPEYRISPIMTYVCRWRLYGTSYQAKSGEKVSARPSPLCGLVPATKSSYTERGYSLYLLRHNDTDYYRMDTYQLHIQWAKVSHKTNILDIDWPFFATETSGIGERGYQFIYAVSKRI